MQDIKLLLYVVNDQKKKKKNDEGTYIRSFSLHRDNHRTRPNYRWKEEIFVRVRERWKGRRELCGKKNNIRRELRFLLLSANFCPTDFQLYKQ